MRRIAVMLACLALATCGPLPPPVDTARMPPASGLGDPVNAIQYSAWAFGSPSRTRGDPATAARAVAGLDYAAGAINTNPRFQGMSPLIDDQLLIARRDVRQVLGVAPAAKSQQVVDAMVAALQALSAHDRATALSALSAPIFTFGPERTLALLTNLPYIRMANVATMEAQNAINGVRCMLCGAGF